MTADATPAPTVAPTASPADQGLAAVVQAAGATIETGTVVVDQTVEFSGSTVIPDGASINASGQAGFATPRQMVLAVDMTAIGQGELGMIVDGSLVYMSGAVFD